VNNSRREMQPGCRSRNRSTLAGKNRLILRFLQPMVLILLPFYIWRQWSIANFIHDIVKISLGMEPDKPSAFLDNADNLSAQLPVTKYDLSPGLECATRFGQDFPDFGCIRNLSHQ